MMLRNLRTPLDLPLLLFLASALIGVWASYDPATSWFKFWLIVLSIILYYLIVWSFGISDFAFAWAGLFLLGSAAFAVYFVTQHDYAAAPSKFDFLTRLGLYLNQWVPQLHLRQPNPNIASGVFEIALPVNAAWLWASMGGRRSAARVKPSTINRIQRFGSFFLRLISCFLIAFGLLMTGSRAAWGALALTAGAGLLIALGNRLRRWLRLAPRIWIPVGLSLVSIGFLAVFKLGDINSLPDWLGVIPVGASAISRAELFGQTWHLIQDYVFTGAGLGVYPMVLSTYALLLNVPFVTHAHDLFLQVWIEQGLVGFIAVVWLVVKFYFWAWKQQSEGGARSAEDRRYGTGRAWQGQTSEWLLAGGIAAVTVMLLHGLVDVLLYSSLELPLMFVPFALAIGSQRLRGEREDRREVRDMASRYGLVLGGLVIIVGLALALDWNQVMARWYANLGSVTQTRVELAQFSYPDRIAEYIRRDCGAPGANCPAGDAGRGELRKTGGYLAQALAFDPGNVTANQRLGAIALAQGSYDEARNYLETAYQRDPSDVVTWQLLGDTYLATGHVEEAYVLWSRVSGAEKKLQDEAWLRYESVQDKTRAGRARDLAERIRTEHGGQ